MNSFFFSLGGKIWIAPEPYDFLINMIYDPARSYFPFYSVNGIPSGNITLTRGKTYTFFVIAPCGFPFGITFSQVGGPEDLVTDGIQGGSACNAGILKFTPNDDHPDVLFYEDANAPFQELGGMIMILGGSSSSSTTTASPSTVNVIPSSSQILSTNSSVVSETEEIPSSSTSDTATDTNTDSNKVLDSQGHYVNKAAWIVPLVLAIFALGILIGAIIA
jgi:hypothetical protein